MARLWAMPDQSPRRRQRRNAGAEARMEIRLPPDVKDQADEQARTEGLALSAWVVGLIRRELGQDEA